MPGHQTFGGSWSGKDFVTLGQDPRIVLPNVPIARQTGSWSLYWNFDQYLAMYSAQPTRGWGVFGRAGVADDDSNPIASFFSAGIGGDSPICGRHQDTFGIGWYYVGTSDEIGPIIQTVLGPIEDGQGVELFYNYQVTPWCHITPDLQFIDPARATVDTATIVGLRAKIDF
jgi:porin